MGDSLWKKSNLEILEVAQDSWLLGLGCVYCCFFFSGTVSLEHQSMGVLGSLALRSMKTSLPPRTLCFQRWLSFSFHGMVLVGMLTYLSFIVQSSIVQIVSMVGHTPE